MAGSMRDRARDRSHHRPGVRRAATRVLGDGRRINASEDACRTCAGNGYVCGCVSAPERSACASTAAAACRRAVSLRRANGDGIETITRARWCPFGMNTSVCWLWPAVTNPPTALTPGIGATQFGDLRIDRPTPNRGCACRLPQTHTNCFPTAVESAPQPSYPRVGHRSAVRRAGSFRCRPSRDRHTPGWSTRRRRNSAPAIRHSRRGRVAGPRPVTATAGRSLSSRRSRSSPLRGFR